MSVIHAGPRPLYARPGICVWGSHFEDVDLWCSDAVVPGGAECATHLIERMHPPVPGGVS